MTRQELHEAECRDEVRYLECTRRCNGRWQIRQGMGGDAKWRNLDPVVTYPSGSELEVLP